MANWNIGVGGVIERSAMTTTSALATKTLYTITGGAIQIRELMAVCVTAQQAVATTLQWNSTPSGAGVTAATISGASASLSGVALGATVLLTPTALTTAPVVALAAAGGVQLGLAAQNHIIILEGLLTSIVANPGTGTWVHYLRYVPLGPNVIVVPS